MSTQEEDLLYKLTDPKQSGPGTWYCIHTMAARVKDYSSAKIAIYFIEEIIKTLKCLECRTHATQYLEKHPVRACLDCKHRHHKGGMERCIFEWTVTFHNAVNARLNKNIINSDVAYTFYYSPDYKVCHVDCGSNNETTGKKDVTKEGTNKPTFFIKGPDTTIKFSSR